MSALSAVLLIISFQFSLLFFHIGCQAARQRIGLRNMGHRTLPKIWVGTFPVRNVHPRGMIFELILTVKIETTHAAEELCCSEFPAICNHCVVIAARSCKTLKFC